MRGTSNKYFPTVFRHTYIYVVETKLIGPQRRPNRAYTIIIPSEHIYILLLLLVPAVALA